MITFLQFQTIREQRDSGIKFVHPNEIKTERPMTMPKNTTQIVIDHSNGKMPLDRKKVKSIEKSIKAGKSLPHLTIKNGILKDGHHRLQAHRNVGSTSVPVKYE